MQYPTLMFIILIISSVVLGIVQGILNSLGKSCIVRELFTIDDNDNSGNNNSSNDKNEKSFGTCVHILHTTNSINK